VVLGLHHVGQRLDVGILARIVQVEMKRVRMPGDGAVMNTSVGFDLLAADFRFARSRSSSLRFW
jgi:hypothetical protein